MRYDLERFTEEIDDDFQCPICHDVLENAVESPHCQHVFCDQCIKNWLSLNSKCPVDNLPLKLEHIKPINRILRNLLFKLKIRCAFEKQGCEAIVTLENLDNHVNSCLFNHNLKVKCEKGCGLMISLNDHSDHNCVAELSHSIKNLYEENLWLKNNILELQSTQLWICSKELTVDNNNQIVCRTGGLGFAQSRFSLTTNGNSYFEVKVVDFGDDKCACIGLTKISLTQIGNLPKSELKYILFYGSDGTLTEYTNNERKMETFGSNWEIGDTIRCGIGQQNEAHVVVVYFKRNNTLVCEKLIKISDETSLYPTVYLKSLGANVIVV